MEITYKSSPSRLVKYFEDSRNKWKARSLVYQEEKRELLIQKRDLERSKDKWKRECLILKIEVKEDTSRFETMALRFSSTASLRIGSVSVFIAYEIKIRTYSK